MDKHYKSTHNYSSHGDGDSDIAQNILMLAISSTGRHVFTLPFISGRSSTLQILKTGVQVLDLSAFEVEPWVHYSNPLDLFLDC